MYTVPQSSVPPNSCNSTSCAIMFMRYTAVFRSWFSYPSFQRDAPRYVRGRGQGFDKAVSFCRSKR